MMGGHLRVTTTSMRESTILIVDDGPDNLAVLGELLRPYHRVLVANSGETALQVAAQTPPPDLILLDIMMPGMSGFEVLQRLAASPLTCTIPVIFTTAMNASESEEQGLALGAVDYITKPLRPAIVLARVRTHLELKHARDRLKSDNTFLEDELDRRMQDNLAIQEVTIRALARLAETRDNETGNHLLRTQAYVRALASRVSAHPRFSDELDEASIDQMARSAPLHDIGKVGIPDSVLLKPGKLTPQEWVVMKTHAKLGADAIERAVADTHQPMKFLTYARQIALHHHERWDGSGYPDGLAGDAIPLAARLMAVADVFDAMISRRVYKQAMPFERVRDEMAAQRGAHFDPDLLDAFIEGFDDYCEIARRFADVVHTDEPSPSAASAAGAVVTA
jgi:putative two-component system response regulator